IAPGSSSGGTLTVNGSASFASGSNLLIDASVNNTAKLHVTGTANLAGDLTVQSSDGTFAVCQTLTVLRADGGLSGTFILVDAGLNPNFSYALSYDADDVLLAINLAHLSPLLSADATANEKGVTGGIDNAIANGDTLPLDFENLGNLSSGDLASATDQ